MERTERTIAVVGLGYVGLPVAEAFARRFGVVGFDIDTRRIAQLRGGIDSTREVTPEALADGPCRRPWTTRNTPDLWPLLAASRTVGGALKPVAIVVFESTVYPGATEEECIPVLEAASGLVHGCDFLVGYSPERINPGDLAEAAKVIENTQSDLNIALMNELAVLFEAAGVTVCRP